MKSLRIGSLDATFRDIELDFGLTIASFELKSGPAQAGVKSFHLHLDQPGQVRAVVNEKAIAAFLDRKAPSALTDFNVTAAGGLLYVEAKAQIVVTLNVKAVCALEIVDGKELHVRLHSVDVMGGAAKSLVESQIAKVNPIFETRSLPFDVTLTSVEADAGQVVLHGIAKP